MNVLHIIAGLHNGGAEGVLYRLAVGDGENTHQVVLLMGFAPYCERLTAAGVAVHTLDMPRGRVTFKGLLKLHHLIRAISPDLIQTWMYHADLLGGVVAKLSGKKTVYWCVRASNAHDFSRSPSKALLWCCAKLSMIVPRKIIYSSQAGERIHRQLGYEGAKSEVIPNGYDTTVLRPDPEARRRKRLEWGVSADTTLLGMVARWDLIKDHETLLMAVRNLCAVLKQPWTCALIGSGMTEKNKELQGLIRRCSVSEKVQLWGLADDIPAVMNALDLHILSSKSEAFPNVLPEAMACGTPCITTNVGDAKSIVGSTGWVVRHSDPNALSKAVEDAVAELSISEKWAERKEACRAHIETHYSLTKMINAYSEVWRRGIDG